MIAKLKGPVLGIGPFHVAYVASFFPLVSMSLKGELPGCHTQTWQPFFLGCPSSGSNTAISIRIACHSPRIQKCAVRHLAPRWRRLSRMPPCPTP